MYNDRTTELFGEHTGLSYIILGLPLAIQPGPSVDVLKTLHPLHNA